MKKQQYERYDWQEYTTLCTQLANHVQARNVKFDSIIAVARGGLIPAQIIAYRINIPEVRIIRCSSYIDVHSKKSPILDMSDIPLGIYHIDNVLIVDDIADTGDTIESIKRSLNLNGNVQVATVFYKKRSVVLPEFYAKLVKNEVWIQMPYD